MALIGSYCLIANASAVVPPPQLLTSVADFNVCFSHSLKAARYPLFFTQIYNWCRQEPSNISSRVYH